MQPDRRAPLPCRLQERPVVVLLVGHDRVHGEGRLDEEHRQIRRRGQKDVAGPRLAMLRLQHRLRRQRTAMHLVGVHAPTRARPRPRPGLLGRRRHVGSVRQGPRLEAGGQGRRHRLLDARRGRQLHRFGRLMDRRRQVRARRGRRTGRRRQRAYQRGRQRLQKRQRRGVHPFRRHQRQKPRRDLLVSRRQRFHHASLVQRRQTVLNIEFHEGGEMDVPRRIVGRFHDGSREREVQRERLPRQPRGRQGA